MSEYKRAEITINGKDFVMTWENSRLYTFRDKQFDHVFLHTDELNRQLGLFVFRVIHAEQYIVLEEHMVTEDYPHIHSPTVPECDIEALQHHLTKDLEEDTFPEEWK